MSFVTLPCYDSMRWEKLCKLLLDPEFKDFNALKKAFKKFRGSSTASTGIAAYFRSSECSLDGLQLSVRLLYAHDEDSETAEGHIKKFFGGLFKFIQSAAKRLPEFYNPETNPLPVLVGRQEGTITIPREAVVSLLAVAFFGGYNEDDYRSYGEPLINNHFPSMNWDFLLDYESPLLPCMLHYFDRVRERNGVMPGVVTLTRKVLLPPKSDASWFASKKPMLPAEIREQGTIEDDIGALQADFANMYLGGGVLTGGNVQEEIRFAINTECLVSMLVAPRMEANEAIVIQGVERFSNYEGYGHMFEWSGPHEDPDKTPEGQPKTTITAFDALEPGHNQFTFANKLRELNKAYAAFSPLADEQQTSNIRPIATGNWGCGAFGGDPELKSIVQWIAASESGRPMHYYVFNRKSLARSLQVVTSVLQRLDVGELSRALLEWNGRRAELFEFLLSKYDPEGTLTEAATAGCATRTDDSSATTTSSQSTQEGRVSRDMSLDTNDSIVPASREVSNSSDGAQGGTEPVSKGSSVDSIFTKFPSHF